MKAHPSAEKAPRASRHLLSRGFKASLAVVLAASVSGAFSTTAYAAESGLLNSWVTAAEESSQPDYRPYNSNDDEAAALSADAAATEFPASYDLRDQGIVTPVKFQNPWGTCWGFSIIAACETSILAKAGTTYEATKLDLSELQLAQAVYNKTGAPASIVGDAQAGEGYYNTSADPNAGLDAGGVMAYGVNAFAAGIGPVLESKAVYKNSGEVGSDSTDAVYVFVIVRRVEKTKENPTGLKASAEYLTQEQIDKRSEELKNEDDVVSYRKRYYAGNWTVKNADGTSTTHYTDWSIATQKGQTAETDDYSWWTSSIMNLESGNELPTTATFDKNGDWAGVDWSAVNAIKSELYDSDGTGGTDYSRAVSIAFHADAATPGSESNPAEYISTEWAHYTYDGSDANHAVTIVGWDDNYAKENFAAGFADADKAKHTPEGNGAWLVKNSWGSESADCAESQEFWDDWGIEDENGKHTGYFWLSYYDRSLEMIETYDFDLSSYNDNTDYVADQYDYMATDKTVLNKFTTPTSAANIFTADADMDVRTLSCATYKPNTTVTFQVYLLDDTNGKESFSPSGDPVYTGEATFEFGGYHRITLDESEWIPMREGQRYAVVTTQKSGDAYYVGVAINEDGLPTSDEEWKIVEANLKKKAADNYIQKYGEQLEEYYTTDEKGIQEFAVLKAQNPGKSDREIISMVVDQMAKTEEGQKEIEQGTAQLVENLKNAHFVGKVNAGESWIGGIGDTGEFEWEDWTGIVDVVKGTEAYAGAAVDNASIKAFAELDDFAEVSELTDLDSAIAAAKALLASACVSEDGSDVAEGKTWMTQADYNALKAAVDAAEKVLATAGDDYKNTLVKGTASSEEVTAQTAAVNAGAAKAVTKPAGEKASAEGEGEAQTQTTVETTVTKKGKKNTPSTGDAANGAAAGLLALAGAACVGAYAARRRHE